MTASRIGELFYKGLTASNTSAPVWQAVTTRAPAESSPPTFTGHLWYAKESFSPTYDAKGNLTNDGRWVYIWNDLDQLIQMETTTTATTAGHPYTKLAFDYDWQGRRIERVIWRGGSAGSPTFHSRRRWLYDGWNPVAEYDSNASGTTNTRLASFTWGLDLSGTLQGAGGVGGLIAKTDITGPVIHRASYDGNGNIVAWTQSTQSAPEHRREYDAFGNTLVSEGTSPSDYGFSTKQQDPFTGLYYYGYRFYDAEYGRWLNRDPVAEAGGGNLYGFVLNDPLSVHDVLGQIPSISCLTGGNCDSGTSLTHHGIYPNTGSTTTGSSKGILGNITKIVPKNPEVSVDAATPSIFVGAIGPVTAFVKAGLKGSVGRCKKKDGTCGTMFAGSVFAVIDVGVGTPPPDAIRTGKFRSGPRNGQRYFKDYDNGRFLKDRWPLGVAATYTTSELPPCANDIDIKGDLKAYISASYLIGSTVINGNIGTCSVKDGCSWKLDGDINSQFSVTNVGVRAGLEFTGSIQGTLSPDAP